MSEFQKGTAIVSNPDDGESYWQPQPSRGYITAKITPYNSPYDNFAAGVQVLEPDGSVVEHAHERSHELIFFYGGEGYAEVDGERTEVSEGSTLMLGRGVQHLIVNTGDTQLKMHWVIFPPGLEDWFKALGRKRTPGEETPEPFERPENIEDIQDRQRFVRPGS